HELDVLRAAMRGMSDAEVAKTFSGTGVLQFYQQSCVPAAYQISIAEVDPYYAFQLRNHPEMVMQEQRDVLIEHGSAQTKRTDIKKDQPASAMKDHLGEPGMHGRLSDQSHYSDNGDHAGIETTEMAGSALKRQLERATGAQYETITADHAAY